jgi:hypothetical protein
METKIAESKALLLEQLQTYKDPNMDMVVIDGRNKS